MTKSEVDGPPAGDPEGERSEPRRFTLTGAQRFGDGDGPVLRLAQMHPCLGPNEVVPVREDRITDADVRAVGDLLYRGGLNELSREPDPFKLRARAQARALLVLVLTADAPSESAHDFESLREWPASARSICRVCGRQKDDPIHAPSESASAGSSTESEV